MEALFLHLGALTFSALCALGMFGPIALAVAYLDRKGWMRDDD